MKKIAFALVLFALVSCQGNKPLNEFSLNRDVKSLKEIQYNAVDDGKGGWTTGNYYSGEKAFFSDDNRIIKVERYSGDLSETQTPQVVNVTNLEEENGQSIRSTYDLNGGLLNNTRYSQDGNVEIATITSADGRIEFEVFTTRVNGLIQSRRYMEHYMDGFVDEYQYVYEYDDNGLLQAANVYRGANNRFSHTLNYRYDEHDGKGNWTKRSAFTPENPDRIQNIVLREIEY